MMHLTTVLGLLLETMNPGGPRLDPLVHLELGYDL